MDKHATAKARQRMGLTAACVASFMLGLPNVARANIGLPMIALVLPAGVLFLPIVIAIEAYLLCRGLGITRARSLKVSALANVASTLLGTPLAWALLLGLELLVKPVAWRVVLHGSMRAPIGFAQELAMVLVTAPWLWSAREAGSWMPPAATLLLLIPFFLASYFVEVLIARRTLSDVSSAAVGGAVWRANAVSYSMFALICLLWLGWRVYIALA